MVWLLLTLLQGCDEEPLLYRCTCSRTGGEKSIEEGGTGEVLDETFSQSVCETETNMINAYKDNGVLIKSLEECEELFSAEYTDVVCDCECEHAGPCD
ncbi:MAG: hypothetical protein CMK59_14780 [Proteobacteria bacterium]|nr:hypothetical protein [Pseudomonadota bacterium]